MALGQHRMLLHWLPLPGERPCGQERQEVPYTVRIRVHPHAEGHQRRARWPSRRASYKIQHTTHDIVWEDISRMNLTNIA